MQKTNRLTVALVISLLVAGVVYVGNAWSPSSYAIVLRTVVADDDGLVAGQPRPIRSDEWMVLTPFTQVAVQNGFQRFHASAIGTEDLRMVFSLPIFDWGIIFKPAFWPYAVADAAHAYSFASYFAIAAFILGYYLFFEHLGIPRAHAALLSFSLFFTGFAQFWWTILGPVLAYFPWVMVALLCRLPLHYKALLVYWTGTMWLLSLFYPPVFISVGFVGAAILLTRKPAAWSNWRTLMVLAAAAAAACGTAVIYLWDYLRETLPTFYPGSRVVGGGGVSSVELASQFVPNLLFSWNFDSLIPPNVCQLATVGSLFSLSVIAFLDYARLREQASRVTSPERDFGVMLIALLVLLICMTAWMLLPVPEAVGRLILWNRVPGDRMKFAAGLALLLVAYLASMRYGLKVTLARVAAFIALFSIITLSWRIGKPELGVADGVLETAPLLAFAAALLAVRSHAIDTVTAFLAGSVALSVVYVAGFNPIQSSAVIFAPHSLWVDGARAQSQERPLVFHGEYGAVDAGLGVRAINHVQVTPKFSFWRALFPDLPEAEFMQAFNRYAHIQVDDVASPVPAVNHVIVPASRLEARTVRVSGMDSLPDETKGNVDGAIVRANQIVIGGWAEWLSYGDHQELLLIADLPITRVSLQTIARPDVVKALQRPEYATAGFLVTIELSRTVTPADVRAIQLVSADRRLGSRFRIPTGTLAAYK